MDTEEHAEKTKRVVPPEDTRPVYLDSNEVREILQELASRTAEMEYRLDRILSRADGIKRFVARDEAGNLTHDEKEGNRFAGSIDAVGAQASDSGNSNDA